MTNKHTNNDSQNSEEQVYDGLTDINGIGSTTVKRLNEYCDIFTLHDLAISSANNIEAGLKEAGLIGVSRSKIESWIAAAQELIAADPQLLLQATKAVNNNNSEGGEWKLVGAFIVDFWEHEKEDQITERHITIDRREVTNGQWVDAQKNPIAIEGKQLYQWMVEALGTKLWPALEEDEEVERAAKEESLSVKQEDGEVVDKDEAANEPVDVKINQIYIAQLPNGAEPIAVSEAGQPFPQSIAAKSPVDLEVTFTLSAPIADKGGKPIKFNGQFYLKNKETNEKIFLGSSIPAAITAGKVDYTARLREISLQPGEYRLRVLVLLHHVPPAGDYREIPSLLVVK